MRIARSAKLTAVGLIVAIAAVGSPLQAAATTNPAGRSLPADLGSGPTLVAAASLLREPRVTVLPSSHRVYDVAPGDTLSQIAYAYCGRADAFPALAAASGLADANRIFPGQRIVLNCAAKPASSAGGTVRTAPKPAPQTNLAGGAAVVAWALTQVGKRYVWGTAGPNTYDCSGLVVAAYARLGIKLPHQSEELMGKGWAVSRSELRPGDVIQPMVGHVVIYVGNGRIVEAANSQLGVITRAMYGFRQARRYI